jgi:hypothetical protein
MVLALFSSRLSGNLVIQYIPFSPSHVARYRVASSLSRRQRFALLYLSRFLGIFKFLQFSLQVSADYRWQLYAKLATPLGGHARPG